MLNKTVSDFITRHQLMDDKGKYLVALSGGADSVALLRVLLQLGYQIEAVHCNFNLRGQESARDETFCRQLCNRHQVSLHIAHFDTRTYANLHHVSIEMAARELRYTYFEQLRNDLGFDGICVAHHQDDSLETILLNLLRGTGIHGLTGIAPKNGYILRPLLCVNHSAIISYLDNIQQDYVTDSSNLTDDVQRNKIRLNVVPQLLQITPAAIDNILKAAEHLSEAEKIITDSLEKDIKRHVVYYLQADNRADSLSVSIADIRKFASPEYYVWYLLKDFHFPAPVSQQIAENLDAPSGTIYSSSSHEALIDRGQLIVEPITPLYPELTIPETGCYRFNDEIKFNVRIDEIGKNYQLSRRPDEIHLDADKVEFPLHIRYAKEGDRFVPYGMTGSKLVSDFMTDLKMNVIEKRHQLVLTDAADKIVWIVTRRASNEVSIRETTKKVLVINIL